MAKYDPHFQLKKPNSDKKTDIRLRLAFDYIDFTWYVKDMLGRIQKIYPFLWDFDHQQPIPKGKIPKKYQMEIYNLQTIQTTIDNVKLLINQIINESIINKTKITNEYLKQEIEIRLGLQKRKKEITVIDFCQQIVKEMEDGTLKTEKGTVYERKTIGQFRVLSTYLQFFRPTSLFSEINDIWHKDFVSFCQNKQKITDNEENILFEKNQCENSYVGSLTKKLKRIMYFAIEKKVSTNKNYKEFKVLKNEYEVSKTDVYLSEKEVQIIYDYTPPSTIVVKGKTISKETLEKAKDLFLIGCYTGLRVSDYNSRLTKDNFKTTDKGNLVLVKSTKKTKAPITIPIYWKDLINIAEKYNYCFPEMSDQKINNYIKEVCKLIGMNDVIEYYNGKGGKIELHRDEKWKLITTHTGRRSASTNLALKGLSEGLVAKFTGHKTNSMVAKYNKASNTETADMIIDTLNSLNK